MPGVAPAGPSSPPAPTSSPSTWPSRVEVRRRSQAAEAPGTGKLRRSFRRREKSATAEGCGGGGVSRAAYRSAEQSLDLVCQRLDFCEQCLAVRGWTAADTGSQGEALIRSCGVGEGLRICQLERFLRIFLPQLIESFHNGFFGSDHNPVAITKLVGRDKNRRSATQVGKLAAFLPRIIHLLHATQRASGPRASPRAVAQSWWLAPFGSYTSLQSFKSRLRALPRHGHRCPPFSERLRGHRRGGCPLSHRLARRADAGDSIDPRRGGDLAGEVTETSPSRSGARAAGAGRPRGDQPVRGATCPNPLSRLRAIW